jgi:hypothetical protein
MPERCVVPYCSAAVSSDAEMIEHLLAAHGWPVLLDMLRDGCIFDCDVCHQE